MNLEQKVQAAIDKHSTQALRDEIQYQLEIDREGGPLDLYTILYDIESREEDNGGRELLTPLRRIFIDLGVYRHVTTEQLARIQTLGCRRKYHFKLDGKCYIFNRHPTQGTAE